MSPGLRTPKALDTSYYAKQPEWDMSKIAGAPTKSAVLASRDHLLAENPKLRVVGAHFGSMESDVDLIAQQLDRYPNFAVDTAARVPHLTIQPRDKVRAFLIKYQDRVLYGTDIGVLHRGEVQPS
ncbi:MAG TPA: amidohydrolase family protein, partial [Edaphobacter sp.]|nr:amidohydrolase family protein [Edaphobacter sp.]